MTLRVFGDALRSGQRTFEAGNGVKGLAIEAENLIAGIGPQGAIGRQVERMNLSSARQSFGRPDQAKAVAIIAVQATFGTGPDIASPVLGERQDGHILEPFSSAV